VRGAAIFALGLLVGACLAAQLVRPYEGPRLAGYGCAGAAGPIYADEESDFPICREILAYGEPGQ
jgi:hypothetical protein